MLKLNQTIYFDDSWVFDLLLCCNPSPNHCRLDRQVSICIYMVHFKNSVWTDSEKNGLRYRLRIMFIEMGLLGLISDIRISAFSILCIASSVWLSFIQSLILKTARRAQIFLLSLLGSLPVLTPKMIVKEDFVRAK